MEQPKKKPPMVTVVVPAYNAERWLEDAYASLLAQRYADWELLIVNDGSTDRTSALARSFTDGRVRVIDQVNGGVSAARNRGIEAASGAYIAFLDADDAMLPDNLALKTAVLDEGHVDWVYSDLWRCDARLSPFRLQAAGEPDELVRNVLTGRGAAVPAATSNILFRRTCFTNGMRFDTGLSNSADQDMVLRSASAFTAQRIPVPLIHYRELPGSMSKNIALFQRDHLMLMRKAQANGLLADRSFRRRCFANAYWTIGGSWWKDANKPLKALPFLVRAVLLRPSLLLRPFRAEDPGS